MEISISIRKANQSDIKTIAKLAHTIWHEYYISIISLEQIEYMLTKMYSSESLLKQMNEGHEFFVFEMNELPIGYLSYSSSDNKNYSLHKFYIDVDKQRKGVGTFIFESILKQLPFSARVIELMVNRENYKALNFYFKIGFVIQSVVNLDIGEGYFMNDFKMIKRLK